MFTDFRETGIQKDNKNFADDNNSVMIAFIYPVGFYELIQFSQYKSLFFSSLFYFALTNLVIFYFFPKYLSTFVIIPIIF